jgi:hypothetical protein
MADDRTIRGAGDRSRINMTMTAARTHMSVSPPNPKACARGALTPTHSTASVGTRCARPWRW